MLTHFRHQPPKFTGDWRVDGPVWSRAIAEYWLSLEKKGALAIQPIDISHLPIFAVEDHIKPDATDHTVGIQAAAAALADAGGGVLEFAQGKNYTLFTNSTTQTFAIDVSGLTNVFIRGNGCTITSALAPGENGEDINFIYAGPVTGLHVEGFKFVGTNSTVATTGEAFLRYGAGCKNITVANCIVTNCRAGVKCDDSTAKNRGVALLDCYFEKCFYPLETMCTDDVFARYTSINGGRCYFPAASNGIGCNNHDISVTSQSGYTSSDCLLKVYATAGGDENVISNIRLNYHSPGRQDGAGNSSDGLIHLAFEQASASTAAGHFRNIRANVHVNGLNSNGDADDWQPYIALITKQTHLGDGQKSDATGRGHTVQDVVIGGVAMNWDDAAGGVRFFDVSTINGGSAQNWSGDTACALAVRDFVINGIPVNDCIYANGQAAVSGEPFLSLDNVLVDGTITYANVSAANISESHVKSSSFDATNVHSRTYTPTWAATGTPTALGSSTITGQWSRRGRKIHAEGNLVITTGGAFNAGTGDYTITLPVAVASGGPNAVGVAYAFDSGTSHYRGVCKAGAGASTMTFYFADAGAVWGAAAPFAPATGDNFQWSIEYWS